MKRKTRYYIRFEPVRELWLVIEDSPEHGPCVLTFYPSKEKAQSVTEELRKSAIPRLALMFPGFK